MEITELPTREAVDQTQLRMRVSSDAGAFAPTQVTFTVANRWAASVVTDVVPALPGLLVLAAKLGEDVAIIGAVPRSVLDASISVGTKLAEWWGWRPPRVTATSTTKDGPGADGIGQFFSLGVDSWSVLLDRLAGPPEQRPTHLLAVDAEPVLPTATVEALLNRTDEIGHELGIPVVRIGTNIRDLLDPFTDWVFETHACVLTGMALMLRPTLGKAVLSATDSSTAVGRYGSHPDLETRWSTPAFALVHEDAERERWQRVETVSGSSLALRNVQVCYRTDRPSNCGRCEKCLRTMTSLLLTGVLGEAVTFDATLTTDAVRAVPDVRDVPAHEILHHLDRHGVTADAYRQAWEEVPIRPGPDATDEREIPFRRPIVVHGDTGVARLSVTEHLNPALHTTAGVRVDHFNTSGNASVSLGWGDGRVGLLPTAARTARTAESVAAAPRREEPWCVLGPAHDDQLVMAGLAEDAFGSGLVLFDDDRPEEETAALAVTARCRLWWCEQEILDPVATLESLLLGCVPFQVAPDATALRSRLRLSAPLDQLVCARSRLAAVTPKHVEVIASELADWLASTDQESLLRDALVSPHASRKRTAWTASPTA